MIDCFLLIVNNKTLFHLCLGVISAEDTSFFIPTSTHSEDGGLLEELCETLILTIVMVLWKGVTGSDDEAWTVC